MSEGLSQNELKGLFSSQTLDVKTPKGIYDELNNEFNFTFDPCPENPDFDGLKVDWGKRNFVNPPYGREIKKWCRKAYEQHKKGKLSVLLIPSRTDTNWWHNYIMKADEIRFVKGRISFEGYDGNAPFPSAVVVFKGVD